MLFGCFAIAALTSGGTYIFLTNYTGISMTSPLPATIVAGIIAVAVGYMFLSIFSFSSDAILQSFFQLLQASEQLVELMRELNWLLLLAFTTGMVTVSNTSGNPEKHEQIPATI